MEFETPKTFTSRNQASFSCSCTRIVDRLSSLWEHLVNLTNPYLDLKSLDAKGIKYESLVFNNKGLYKAPTDPAHILFTKAVEFNQSSSR
jgi:hypothetical protein